MVLDDAFFDPVEPGSPRDLVRLPAKPWIEELLAVRVEREEHVGGGRHHPEGVLLAHPRVAPLVEPLRPRRRFVLGEGIPPAVLKALVVRTLLVRVGELVDRDLDGVAVQQGGKGVSGRKARGWWGLASGESSSRERRSRPIFR